MIQRDKEKKPNPTFDSPTLKEYFRHNYSLETDLMSVVLVGNPSHDFLVDPEERCGFLSAKQLADVLKEFDKSFEKIAGLPAEENIGINNVYPIEIVEGWENPQRDGTRLVISGYSVDRDDNVTFEVRKQAEMVTELVPEAVTIPGTIHKQETGVAKDHRNYNADAGIDKRFLSTATLAPDTPICVVFHKAYLR